MRARILALGLVAGLIAACDCGGQVQQSNGILLLTPKAVDFGTGCLNGTVTREVLLENAGNADLAVLDVKVSGGAFALLTEAPTVVERKSQLVLQLGFTPTADGDFAGSVEVKTDAKENATQRATLLGAGFDGPRQDFIVLCERTPGAGDFDDRNPCAFLDFGRPLYDTTVERAARLTNRGCAPVTVSDLSLRPEVGSTTPEDVKLFSLVEGAAPLTVGGRAFTDVKVRFAAPKSDAVPAVDLHVATDDPAHGDLSISLLAFPVGPSLVVNPGMLTFFDAATGSVSTKYFSIANAGTSPMQVDTVALAFEAGSAGFTLSGGDAPFTLPPATSRTIQVVYAPTGKGRDAATVTVKAGQEAAAVKLVGGADPLLVVTWLDGAAENVPPVDFGRVDTGTKGVSRTVRLKNDGRAPLLIASIEVSAASNPGGSYKLVGAAPNRIEPGATADVTVSFDDAVKLRDDGAKLRIVSNDAVDAYGGRERLVDLVSSNDPNFDPVPNIRVVACPQGVTVGDARCQEAPTLDWELTVDGSASTGPEVGDTLSFKWSFSSVPTGSTARFETPTGASTRIVSASGNKVDLMGRYIVKLVVTDQFGNQSAPGTQVLDVSR